MNIVTTTDLSKLRPRTERRRRDHRRRRAHRAARRQRPGARAGNPGDDQHDGSGRARRHRAPAAGRATRASARISMSGIMRRRRSAWVCARPPKSRRSTGARRIPRRGVRRQGTRRRRHPHPRGRQCRALRSARAAQAFRTMNSNKPRLCFIGFGEAGQAIAVGPARGGRRAASPRGISCFPKDEGARLKQAGETIGARLAQFGGRRGRNSDIIISAVTAASSLDAAQSVAPHLCGQSLFSRHQLGLARPQAGDRRAARRRGALCRRRDPRADPSRSATRRRCCSPGRMRRP